jgi:bile acid-coenzyme A ligase
MASEPSPPARDRRPAPISVDDRLTELGRRDPDRPALIGVGSTALTWSEVDERTRRRAAELAPAPITMVDAANEPESALEILAYLRAGVPVLPVNPLTKPAEREAVAARLMAPPAGAGPPTAGAGRLTMPAAGHGPVAVPPPVPVPAAGAPAYALLTGGSTGHPKPVLFPGPLTYSSRTHPNPLLARTGWRDNQRQLVVAPLHHAAAFSCFLAGVLCGNTIALLPAFHRELFWTALAELAIEWLALTPAHMRAALPAPAAPPPALRAVLHTGAPCEPDLKRNWIGLVGPERLFEMYGGTEGTGVTLVRGDEWLARPGTVGRGVWTRIRVLDPEQRDLPAGTVGEVYLRTPHGPRIARPGQRATPGGYLSIGDHGWLDEDGYLYLSGRADDLIIVGGENVYPAEIEATIRTHPAVRDAAVVGTPDPLLGQRPRAFVVAPGLAADELRRHCARHLSAFKLPSDVTFVDELPRSALGKLQRWRLV